MFATISFGVMSGNLSFKVLVNKNYNEAYIYIPLMIFSTYYASMSNFSSGIFAAYKDNKILAPTTFVAAILNFVLGVLLIKPLGLFGPIIGTFVAYFIINKYRNYASFTTISLSWTVYITESEYYKEYMSAKENTYADDKMIWRQIFKRVIFTYKPFEERLEAMDLYWNDDIEIVASFVEKTIKKFEEASGGEFANDRMMLS